MRPCWGCGHDHDPESPGRCWEDEIRLTGVPQDWEELN